MGLDFIHGWLIVLSYSMKRLLYILLVSVVSICQGCKKNQLDDGAFESPARRYDLAVEGGFQTLFPDQYIRLTRPALHPDSSPVPISKASVVVNDGRNNLIYRETPTPGVYTMRTNSDPNYNNAYTLTIKYNNKTYTAVDTLRQVVNIVDDFLPLSTRLIADNNVEIVIPKHTFGYLNPNKWYISYKTVPAWSPSKFDQSIYYSYTHSLGSPNSLYPLNNLKRTFPLGPEDFILINKISLSSKYAKYLYSVFMETDWNGLFSGVPVNVESNVSGNAQGFFSVVDVDRRPFRAKDL